MRNIYRPSTLTIPFTNNKEYGFMHSKKRLCSLLAIVLLTSRPFFAATNAYSIDVSSNFSGSGDPEALYGSAFLSHISLPWRG
jgi:hypothetical protein